MTPTSEEVFGRLNTRLFEIKTGKATHSGVTGSVFIEPITKHIFSIPIQEALLNIDTVVKTIEQIMKLEDDLVTAYKDMDYVNPEFDDIKQLNEQEKQQVKARFISDLKKEVTGYAEHLEKYREELLDKEEARSTYVSERIKLDITVEELATLFRGLEEAKVLSGPGHSPLSRIIAHTFTSKKNDNLSHNSIKNFLDAPTEKGIKNTTIMLRNVISALENLKK